MKAARGGELFFFIPLSWEVGFANIFLVRSRLFFPTNEEKEKSENVSLPGIQYIFNYTGATSAVCLGGVAPPPVCLNALG